MDRRFAVIRSAEKRLREVLGQERTGESDEKNTWVKHGKRSRILLTRCL